jgi:hypothetical protein
MLPFAPFPPQAPRVGVVVLCGRSLYPLCLCGEKFRYPLPSCHRTRTVPARLLTAPRSITAHYSTDVGYQCGAFSALCASSHSVARCSQHDMQISNVNKCTYLYRQLTSSPSSQPPKKRSMWLNVAPSDLLSLAVISRRSSPSSPTSPNFHQCEEMWGSAPPYDTLARCSVRK